jgi:urate oxidase
MSSTPEEPIPNPPISAEEQASADLLSEQDLEMIDACILSHCADRFHKVARIMYRTQNELTNRFPKLSHVFYTQRLKHLVDTGRLNAAGNVFKMRFSEVRIADKKI